MKWETLQLALTELIGQDELSSTLQQTSFNQQNVHPINFYHFCTITDIGSKDRWTFRWKSKFQFYFLLAGTLEIFGSAIYQIRTLEKTALQLQNWHLTARLLAMPSHWKDGDHLLAMPLHGKDGDHLFANNFPPWYLMKEVFQYGILEYFMSWRW